MHLTGFHYKQLEDALLSTFLSYESLERMVRHQLDENLAVIAGGKDLRDVVFKLIRWAMSTGRVEELIAKAYEENPGNPELRDFFELLQSGILSNQGSVFPSSQEPFEPTLTFPSSYKGVKYFHSSNLPANWASRNKVIDLLVENILNKDIRLTLVRGIGGSGKSTVVKKLMTELTERRLQLRGLFWFSFYMEDDVDHFFAEAGQCFIPGFKPADYPSPFVKSMMLREALSQEQYLLVLDGIETLQNTDLKSPIYGALKDRPLRDLLLGLCVDQQNTKVIITSRDPLTELEGQRGYNDFILPLLEPDAAVDYMINAGVIGDRQEISLICERFGYHPLTLAVLADYLIQPPNNGKFTGIGNLADIPADTPQASKLFSILEYYWKKLNKSERYFMSRLALFRFGARDTALSLMAADEDGVACSASNVVFSKTLRRLNKSALLEVTKSDGTTIYSLHPLIKEYVKNCLSYDEQIKIHSELLKYAQRVPFTSEPASLQDMQPFLDLYYHLIGSRQYDRAFSIIRTPRQGMRLLNRLFCWGHYSLTYDFLLSPLIDAYQKQQWKPSPEKLSYLFRQAGNVTAKAKSTLEAEHLYNTAIKASSGDLASMTNPVQQYLCELYIEAGRFYLARQVLSELKTLLSQPESYSKYYRIIGREGYINACIGNVPDAISQLTRAIEMAGDSTDGNEGYQCLFYRVLGDLYVNAGSYQDAWDAYENGLSITRESINVFKDYEGHILRGIADIHRLQGNTEAAIQFYTDSLTIGSTTGYLWLEAEALVGVASALLSESEFGASSHKAEEALKIAQTGGWFVPQIQSHIILAQTAINDGNLAKASEHIIAADTLTQESGYYWSRLPLKDIKEQLLEGR